MTEPPQELGVILEEGLDEEPEDANEERNEGEEDVFDYGKEEEEEEGWGKEAEEDEGEEQEEEEIEGSEESDDEIGYTSRYEAERQREAAAKEKAKEEFRNLINLSKKRKTEGSIATIITIEEELLGESAGSSSTSTYPCLRDIDISDSQLKLLNLFNLYPVPEDPGLVPAFWMLYPPPPVYSENGVQRFIDLMEALGLRPMQCVSELLKTERINLRYYGVDPGSVKAICEATFFNTTVQAFNLKDNWLTVDACFHLNDLLIENIIISHLCLSGCRIGPQGVERLLEGIGVSHSLLELDLSHCALEDEGVKLLAPVVGDHLTLQSLNLADNHLGINCAKALQFMLMNNVSLLHLDLSWNGLFPKEASKALFKGLVTNVSLVQVNLSWNAFGKECLQHLCHFVARTRHVLHLNLSGNRFTEQGSKLLGNALARNVVTEEFYIGNNPLKPDGAFALVGAATPERSPNSHLQLLDLENVWANKDILPDLRKIETDRPWLKVRLGGIFSDYKLIGPDARKIFLKRANYEAMKPKKMKHRRDFGHFILTLEDKLISKGKFKSLVNDFKMKLSASLVKELAKAFPGQQGTVDLRAMKTFYLEQYPDTSPPLERKLKKGKVKGDKKDKGTDKGKGKGKEQSGKLKQKEKEAAKLQAKAKAKGKEVKAKKLKKEKAAESSTEKEGESDDESAGEYQGEDWYADEIPPAPAVQPSTIGKVKSTTVKSSALNPTIGFAEAVLVDSIA